jgi:hypothetical protein
MNIIIEKDVVDYITKHSNDNFITLLMKTGGGG